MALLVPLLKPNYNLYAPNKPSSIYGLAQPSPYYNSAPARNTTANTARYNLTNGHASPLPNYNIYCNKAKSGGPPSQTTPRNGVAKSGGPPNATGGKITHKTPTTIVVNGNIIYSTGICSGKYILPPGLILAPTANSCATGAARRFRSLSERSRVITPMPIIFENERLGSGPEMLFHPHTAPPVRKTRKSKSLPTSNGDCNGQRTRATPKNAKEGASIRKWFFTKPVTLSGLATTLVSMTTTNSANSTTVFCSCEACLCPCNMERAGARAGKRKKVQTNPDKQAKHRHRGTCNKGDSVNPESFDSSLDVNNNRTHTGKTLKKHCKLPLAERLGLIESGTACNPDDDLNLLCPPLAQTGRKLSCGSNSNNSSSSTNSCDSGPDTPSPSPPNRSPLNSEIALAGKFAFAQLYHNHHNNAKHYRKTRAGTANTNNGNNNNNNGNNSKMVMLLRSLSGKLTLKHKDGTPFGEELMNRQPCDNDITLTASNATTRTAILDATTSLPLVNEIISPTVPTRPVTLPGLGSSLTLLAPPSLTTNNTSSTSPNIPFFKRFRTISR